MAPDHYSLPPLPFLLQHGISSSLERCQEDAVSSSSEPNQELQYLGCGVPHTPSSMLQKLNSMWVLLPLGRFLARQVAIKQVSNNGTLNILNLPCSLGSGFMSRDTSQEDQSLLLIPRDLFTKQGCQSERNSPCPRAYLWSRDSDILYRRGRP